MSDRDEQDQSWEDFWSGEDAPAKTDGGDDHDHPHDEDAVIHGPIGHDLTYREIHAFAYGVVPAFLAFFMFEGVHHLAWLGIIALGVAAAFGLKEIPNEVINRAVVREPAYFLGGVVLGVVTGGVLQTLFALAGVI